MMSRARLRARVTARTTRNNEGDDDTRHGERKRRIETEIRKDNLTIMTIDMSEMMNPYRPLSRPDFPRTNRFILRHLRLHARTDF